MSATPSVHPWRIGAICIAGLLLGCATNTQPMLNGSVSYRERVALPDDAVIEIQLSDVSRQDVAADVIAETTVRPDGRQVPIPFQLPYPADRIQADHTYAVRALIRSQGRMMFATDRAHHVLTRGNPSSVEIMLVRADGRQ
jgi:putative lipoprotein